MPRQRVRGSVRFDPYYKLQWWDERTLSWRPTKGRYPSPKAARAAMTGEHTWRIVRVAMDEKHVPIDV